MHISLPIVVLLSLAVISGVWWNNTRKMDFLTPPSAAMLESVKIKAVASIARSSKNQPTPHEETKITPAIVVAPTIDLGDLTTPPSLNHFQDRAQQGSDSMIQLALALEKAGEFQRALLAWERMLDSTKPDAAQANAAISAIKRIKPTLTDWNQDSASALKIIVQVDTGKKLATEIKPLHEELARRLTQLSSGLVRADAALKISKTSPSSKKKSPVAMSLTGGDPNTSSTDVLSFPVETPEMLREALLKNFYVLVQGQFTSHKNLTAPLPLADGENPEDALNYRITRLAWQEFARTLNLPLTKTP